MKEHQPWYAEQIEPLFHTLQSSPSGLSREEAEKRLLEFGPNILESRSKETFWSIFIRQWKSPLIYVLLGSTVLALFLRKWADSAVIFCVVLLNTLISFFQEWRAHKTIGSLRAMVPSLTTVVRNGQTLQIPAEEVVPGDCLFLQAGDRIAADVRLFSLKNLECDESALTGESLPVTKAVTLCPADAPLAERKCMGFSGTYVTAGTAYGIAVATGLKTEFGKITQLISDVSSLETPLTLTIKKIAQWITFVVLIVSGALFLINYLRGAPFFEAGLASIALAVAAIPEGLPAIITIAASIGVHRMARRNAIIRQLPAVEALGSTSVICTDKTGTLTRNEITVQAIWVPSGLCFVSGVGYHAEGAVHFSQEIKGQKEEIEALLIASVLCNDATIAQATPVGDPTEIALLVAARKMGLEENHIHKSWARKDVMPFESEKRMMATLHTHGSENFIIVKGAPEEILALCKLSDHKVEKELLSMAKEGMRTLAVAHKKTSSQNITENELKEEFQILGLIGMIDPPRKEVYRALKACYTAGISVKMVTGDHPLTAQAIGEELGIPGKAIALTGAYTSTTPEEWKEIALQYNIFARVAPEHKLKLVNALQESGEVVAMTGDGVNDGPALKQADIGVAMGIKGTEVAKEAADMILADDNFATIESAVEEGRRVYDNLLKSLAFVLPTSLGQALVILIGVLFFPIRHGIWLHPMSPVQILWVNLVVAVALSLPLAFEAMDPGIMHRPPRKKNAPLLTGFLLFKTLSVSFYMALGTVGLFLWQYMVDERMGVSTQEALAHAQTTAVTGIIFFQIFYLFNCRSNGFQKKTFFKNWTVFLGVLVVLLAQAAYIYLPFMHSLFQSAPVDGASLLLAFLVGMMILPLTALENFFLRKKREREATPG